METTIKGYKMTKERAIIELALQKTITIKDIQGGTF